MTNTIFIDIDTSRERPIIFGKPPEFEKPQTKEEAAKMILSDIIGLSQALKELIIIATDSNYSTNTELIDAVIKTIKEAKIDLPNETN